MAAAPQPPLPTQTAPATSPFAVPTWLSSVPSAIGAKTRFGFAAWSLGGNANALGEEVGKHARPAVIRAFEAAKGVSGATSGPEADYVVRREFRLLLVYLRQYFELYVAYNRLDSSDDRRLSLPEFRAGVAAMGERARGVRAVAWERRSRPHQPV